MHQIINRLGVREFRLIIGGLALLIIAGALSYGAVPQWKKYNASRAKLDALLVLPPAGDITIQLQGMREMVEGLRHVVHGEAGTLPARELEAYLIGKLQAISWSHDIELAGVKPGQRKKLRGFWETTFKVEIQGEYQQIYAWLSDIGKQLGYVVIKEFQLTPRGGSTTDPRLQATMTIASYQSN